MFVEFVSSPAGPLLNTGFHFNVGNWPGHVDTAGSRTGACDWMLSSDALKDSNASEGIFLSIAHWYPPNTTCSYHIQGNEGEVVRLYFPRFVQHIRTYYIFIHTHTHEILYLIFTVEYLSVAIYMPFYTNAQPKHIFTVRHADKDKFREWKIYKVIRIVKEIEREGEGGCWEADIIAVDEVASGMRW